jgi:hypothetical protein
MVSKRCPTLRRCGPRPVPAHVVEPRLWREAHRLGYRQHLLVARILYPALAEVGDVGTGHDYASGTLELDTTPPAAVVATVPFQKALDDPGDLRQVPSFQFAIRPYDK